MRPLKITFIHHRGFFLNHLLKQLGIIMEEKDVTIEYFSLDDALKHRTIDADVLIYHTFPGEYNPKKFNAPLVKRADEIFKAFKGIEILYDSHDDGNIDAFTRFNNSKIPRIKCNPSFGFLENYNVIHEVFTDAQESEVEESALQLYELLRDMVYPPIVEEPITEPKPKPKTKKIVKKRTSKPRKILKRKKEEE